MATVPGSGTGKTQLQSFGSGTIVRGSIVQGNRSKSSTMTMGVGVGTVTPPPPPDSRMIFNFTATGTIVLTPGG